MNIAEMILHRRSVRAYRNEAVAPETLAALQERMAELVPLIPGAKVEGRIIPTRHGSFLQKWATPHFIVIFSEPTDDGLLNAGFMYQQLDLYAQSLGLGTCWVGLGSLEGGEPIPAGMKVAVMMAVGVPDGVARRTGAADFKRKAMAEITDWPDERLEALRLAPSATKLVIFSIRIPRSYVCGLQIFVYHTIYSMVVFHEQSTYQRNNRNMNLKYHHLSPLST